MRVPDQEIVSENFGYVVPHVEDRTLRDGGIAALSDVADMTEAERLPAGTVGLTVLPLETGFEIRVPLFIKKGDKVKVNTETREFAGRS